MTKASPDNPSAVSSPGSARSLWLWVAAGFLLLAIGWTVLFTVARSAKIESVPGPTQGGKARTS